MVLENKQAFSTQYSLILKAMVNFQISADFKGTTSLK